MFDKCIYSIFLHILFYNMNNKYINGSKHHICLQKLRYESEFKHNWTLFHIKLFHLLYEFIFVHFLICSLKCVCTPLFSINCDCKKMQ